MGVSAGSGQRRRLAPQAGQALREQLGKINRPRRRRDRNRRVRAMSAAVESSRRDANRRAVVGATVEYVRRASPRFGEAVPVIGLPVRSESPEDRQRVSLSDHGYLAGRDGDEPRELVGRTAGDSVTARMAPRRPGGHGMVGRVVVVGGAARHRWRTHRTRGAAGRDVGTWPAGLPSGRLRRSANGSVGGIGLTSGAARRLGEVVHPERPREPARRRRSNHVPTGAGASAGSDGGAVRQWIRGVWSRRRHVDYCRTGTALCR